MQVAKADSNEAIRGISWGPNRHRCSFEGGHIDKFKKTKVCICDDDEMFSNSSAGRLNCYHKIPNFT